MLELNEVIENIMALPLNTKAYILEMLIEDIDAQKKETSALSQKRSFGEYIGKITLSDDFDAPLPDEFWLGESNEIAT